MTRSHLTESIEKAIRNKERKRSNSLPNLSLPSHEFSIQTQQVRGKAPTVQLNMVEVRCILSHMTELQPS